MQLVQQIFSNKVDIFPLLWSSLKLHFPRLPYMRHRSSTQQFTIQTFAYTSTFFQRILNSTPLAEPCRLILLFLCWENICIVQRVFFHLCKIVSTTSEHGKWERSENVNGEKMFSFVAIFSFFFLFFHRARNAVTLAAESTGMLFACKRQ